MIKSNHQQSVKSFCRHIRPHLLETFQNRKKSLNIHRCDRRMDQSRKQSRIIRYNISTQYLSHSAEILIFVHQFVQFFQRNLSSGICWLVFKCRCKVIYICQTLQCAVRTLLSILYLLNDDVK